MEFFTKIKTKGIHKKNLFKMFARIESDCTLRLGLIVRVQRLYSLYLSATSLIKQDLKLREAKPLVVNQQCLVYKLECGLYDTGCVGFTRGRPVCITE